jgi:hypothetical protein
MEDAKAKCPTCGSAFPAGATFCPECGYVVPVSTPASPSLQRIVPPTPQPSVVYVQQPAAEPRESNWGPWVAVAAVILLIGGGFALWSGGYIGGGSPAAAPPTTVTIDNSPRMSSETPPDSPQLAVLPAPAPVTPPAATPPPAVAPPAAPPSKTPAIDIVSVKGQALETNDIEWKYGYTMLLRNNTDAAVKGTYRIQFLDEQGFPVEDALMKDLVVPANAKLSFDGVSMIKTPLATRIRTLRAEMR